jgi:hypothetical protein
MYDADMIHVYRNVTQCNATQYFTIQINTKNCNLIQLESINDFISM